MSLLAADQAELLRVLARHGVEFVVVGEVAAQLHGWQGATADLDVSVATDDSNVELLNRALADVGAGEPMIGAFGTVFMTAYGRLEIVRRADAVGHHRSKEAAGREKDRAALPQMRRDFRDSGAL